MMDKLAAVLSSVQEYIDLAAKAEDNGEHERFERIRRAISQDRGRSLRH
jgi:hypothetical protein